MPITVRVQDFQSIGDATVVIDRFTVVTGPNNSGKALANGTLVATPNGWVPVESLEIGDFVLAGDGSPTQVLGVYPQGQRKTCIIEFDDGRAATVDLDHLWEVSIGGSRFHKGGGQTWDVLSTQDIWARVGDEPTKYQRPAIPRAGPAQYQHHPVPLDPYLTGCLLGDGCLQPSSVRISSVDKEILREVELALPLGVSLNSCGGCDYRLRTPRGQPNPVLISIQNLGLAGRKAHEKFIPSIYQWNDIETRVALLQGLMDTDGGVNAQGIAEFYSSSTFLVEGVVEIVRSLGGSARIRTKDPTYKYKGEQRVGRKTYTVTIRLPNFDLFRLPRKAEKVGELSRRIQPLMVAFKKGPTTNCTCIEVAHDSHLFQMEGHLVTHNTALMRAIRGVFLNSPAGPLVRRGAAQLTVTLTFDDGNVVVWEKGWERPEQKGKTVNRYTLNGRELADVGRGCPPEVLELGISPIKAGPKDVWPQIADQFTGVLFLVGSPGSATAEAIANVDRVGKLSSALKLSESARRKVTNKLNVRRDDEKTLSEEASAYDGVDLVASTVKAIEDATVDAELLHDQVVDLETLRTQWSTATSRVEAYQGIQDVPFVEQASVDEVVALRKKLNGLQTIQTNHRNAIGHVNRYEGVGTVTLTTTIKTVGAAVALRKELNGLTALQTLYTKATSRVNRYAGVGGVSLPDSKPVREATDLRDDLATYKSLRSRLKAAKATLDAYEDVPDITLPEPKRLQKMKTAVGYFTGLQTRRNQNKSNVESLEEALRLAGIEQATAEKAVTNLIGERGECPTCGVIAGPDGVHRHEEVA